MSADIEELKRILELSQKEVNQQADEKKKKADALASEARKRAKADLPQWTQSIEKAIRESRDGSKSRILNYKRENRKFLFFFAPVCIFSWEKDCLPIAPRIDLERLCSDSSGIPLDVYTEELTKLLGKPFKIGHYASPLEKDDPDYALWHTEFFSIKWG